MSIESMALVNTGQAQDNEASPQLMSFCRRLVRQTQWRSHRMLCAGSRMEIPAHLNTAELLRIDIGKLDMDKMVYDIYKCAVSRSRSMPDAYTGEIVRIYTQGTHTGYVNLIKEKDNTELQWSECVNLPEVISGGDPRHGPAVYERDHIPHFDNDYDYSNPAVNRRALKRLVIVSADLVFAIHNPYWPEEAAEWVARRRSHGLPSKSVINEVVSYGCDFVNVSHKAGDQFGNEWRFSFSKAELLIIKSWTVMQRNAYTVLWLINKKLDDSNMCTYYIKTIMLWAYEEKASDFWEDDFLVDSTREVLIYVITCLKYKFCPNYFLPANNMMDHLLDVDLSRDIGSLFKYVNTPEIPASLAKCDIVLKAANTKCYVLSAWIKRAVLIYTRMNYEEDSFAGLYGSTFEPRILNALQVELYDIHKGLCFHKMAAGCNYASVAQIYNFKMSEMHLRRCTTLFESDKTETLDNCTHVIVRFIFNTFENMEVPRVKKQDYDKSGRPTVTSNASAVSKESLIHQINETDVMKRKIIFRSVETWRFPFPPTIKSAVHAYFDWPGVSPTVNVSWFIAKAYLANLYYTTNRDVSLILKTCDDIIDVYKQTYKNERFGEKGFPIVLSTQWITIYDKEIQRQLGFYSLCKYIWTQSSSRSVYLGVCPVLFAHYLKVRAAGYADKTHMRNCFISHLLVCKCDIRVDNGKEVLLYCAMYKY